MFLLEEFLMPEVILVGIAALAPLLLIRRWADRHQWGLIGACILLLLFFPPVPLWLAAILYFTQYAIRVMYNIYFTTEPLDVPRWLLLLNGQTEKAMNRFIASVRLAREHPSPQPAPRRS